MIRRLFSGFKKKQIEQKKNLTEDQERDFELNDSQLEVVSGGVHGNPSSANTQVAQNGGGNSINGSQSIRVGTNRPSEPTQQQMPH
ncbi:hypothetical protein [Aquimarina brevivitae]|uniref:Uncharacterized protein n=1 Tax=Aquimarina brevivitae TaxID=323412 RepID=A0A4Q7P1K3_9FLAO|nr:hypothetical protein [Aquimarina brevivitae]RZS93198.1 hypothetical protein EV197_1769 [Aquimarina brevivitae]